MNQTQTAQLSRKNINTSKSASTLKSSVVSDQTDKASSPLKVFNQKTSPTKRVIVSASANNFSSSHQNLIQKRCDKKFIQKGNKPFQLNTQKQQQQQTRVTLRQLRLQSASSPYEQYTKIIPQASQSTKAIKTPLINTKRELAIEVENIVSPLGLRTSSNLLRKQANRLQASVLPQFGSNLQINDIVETVKSRERAESEYSNYIRKRKLVDGQTQSENHRLKIENTKLKQEIETLLRDYEELVRFSEPENHNKLKQPSHEKALVIKLKGQVRELQEQVKERDEQIVELNQCTRITHQKEVEAQLDMFTSECIRLRQLIDKQQNIRSVNGQEVECDKSYKQVHSNVALTAEVKQRQKLQTQLHHTQADNTRLTNKLEWTQQKLNKLVEISNRKQTDEKYNQIQIDKIHQLEEQIKTKNDKIASRDHVFRDNEHMTKQVTYLQKQLAEMFNEKKRLKNRIDQSEKKIHCLHDASKRANQQAIYKQKELLESLQQAKQMFAIEAVSQESDQYSASNDK